MTTLATLNWTDVDPALCCSLLVTDEAPGARLNCLQSASVYFSLADVAGSAQCVIGHMYVCIHACVWVWVRERACVCVCVCVCVFHGELCVLNFKLCIVNLLAGFFLKGWGTRGRGSPCPLQPPCGRVQPIPVLV